MTDIAGHNYISTRGSAAETSTDSAPRWQDRAACFGKSDLFFDADRWIEARRLCLSCDVRDECLDDGLARGDFETFRAGFSPKELLEIANVVKRPRLVGTCLECAGPVRGRANWCSPECRFKKINRDRRHGA